LDLKTFALIAVLDYFNCKVKEGEEEPETKKRKKGKKKEAVFRKVSLPPSFSPSFPLSCYLPLFNVFIFIFNIFLMFLFFLDVRNRSDGVCFS
jgi:hypothetical protein